MQGPTIPSETYRLASSTRRCISAVRSAFLYTIAPRYTNLVVCLFVCTQVAGCLSSESNPAHTFHHQAHGLRLGFRNCQFERPRTATISAIIFASLFLDLETMPASSAYCIPSLGCDTATVSWGLSRPLSVPPRFSRPSISSLALVHTTSDQRP